MRFDRLFDDLEAQFDAQFAAGAAHERAEQERLRAARSTLRDRIVALVAAGGAVRVRLVEGSVVDIAGATIGRDWIAAELPSGAEVVLPLASVASLALGVGQLRENRERTPEPPSSDALSGKLGIGVVLRDLARRRAAVDVLTPAERAPLHGTIDRVGSDHFDLAVHERGAARRETSVVERRIVTLASVLMLRV